jgi:tripeptidyl-peptidase-1
MRSAISGIRPVDKSSDAAAAGVTPKSLQSLYNFGSATSISAGRMGIGGFLEQWPSESDLSTFMQSYAVQGNSDQTYTCTLINGGTCPSNGGGNPGDEANLDVQYARAITESIPNVYYSTGGSPPIVGGGTNTNEPYLEFLNFLLALDDSDLPNTLSISYGDDEDTVPLDYADSTCDLFSQLGARGVSILVASGDSGVGSTCQSGGQTVFTTSYPASCPWVTVVGGTTGSSPESGWSGGGGGFSSVFGRPSYQDTVVSSWLTNDQTHSGVTKYFNSSGRAYPDVAAQATDFTIVIDGSDTAVDGTSCATPTFASIIQLINSNRISAGKAGLGFLNPWLYGTASSALTDITDGGNTGCSGVISGAGFDAVTVSLVKPSVTKHSLTTCDCRDGILPPVLEHQTTRSYWPFPILRNVTSSKCGRMDAITFEAGGDKAVHIIIDQPSLARYEMHHTTSHPLLFSRFEW